MAIFHPRITLPKLLILTSITLLLLFIYTSSPTLTPIQPLPDSSKLRSTCSPEQYANGTWESLLSPRTSASVMTNPDQALEFSGFEGCASSREYYWHLASDNEGQYDRFPKAQSYTWEPSAECGIAPLDPAGIVKELVEGGGWLLIGDSVTENHFFSLSCLLYPHVLATPNYTANPHWDRAWPQNLYLSPLSPLLSTLTLPAGFDMKKTPLVTFRRVDLLLAQEEVITVQKNAGVNPNGSLFSDEAVWTLPIQTYLDIFATPLPEGNYATMVVSTGGHWTTTLFSGLKDESQPGDGIDSVLKLFKSSMRNWAQEVQGYLWKLERGARGAGKKRRVLIRAYLPGHEDCHSHRAPWKEIVPFVWGWYNWGRIWEFNSIYENVVSDKTKYPDIHYLGIDRPARLRPDAHTTGDCLHIMTGAGVLEGWSHYIWHYVTREVRR